MIHRHASSASASRSAFSSVFKPLQIPLRRSHSPRFLRRSENRCPFKFHFHTPGSSRNANRRDSKRHRLLYLAAPLLHYADRCSRRCRWRFGCFPSDSSSSVSDYYGFDDLLNSKESSLQKNIQIFMEKETAPIVAELLLANPGPIVMEKLQASMFIEIIGHDKIFLTVGEAVMRCAPKLK